MNEEEKNAVEYLKIRLYGNEGCKSIDVAQEDLRIFINLIDRKEKDIEGWKKHCKEIEEEQTETSNKNCELEFKVEKLQKENEKLKNKLLDTLEGQKVIKEETPQYIKENYIPVEKIKDKIEELEQKREEYYNENKLIIDNIINKKEFYRKFDTQDIHTYAIFDEFNAEISLSRELIEGREKK